ncbi:MAG: AAA family ATPase [Rikenellaceae bacterium]
MNKEIFLKRMSILNIKGIRSLNINFDGQETVICGENGTGKTTILDAFLWLLFGKDSTNRADSNFNIKTLDSDGKPILKMDHEVSATLIVNGNEVTLKRSYKEKWGIGSNAGKLTNHFTEFYVNDVKLGTKKEYDSEVSAIIPEDVFRMVTNPLYFPNLPGETQKAMLMDMAGNVSDQDIAAIKPEFLELLSQLTGRTLAQYKKEISAKKNAIKDEIAGIPGRVDEVNRAIPVGEDWKGLEAELKDKQTKLQDIDSQLIDKSKLSEAENNRKVGIQKQIGEKRLERSNIENKIRSEASDTNNKARAAIVDFDYKINTITSEIDRVHRDNSGIDRMIESVNTQLNTLRAKYKEINAEQLNIPEGEFMCPTCKRPLEVADIEAKQNELHANFNQRKSERLQANQADGKGKATELKELQCKKDQNLVKISDLENQITTLKGQKQFQEESLPAAQDANSIIQADQSWIALGNQISDLENQMSVESTPVDNSELKEGKQVLTESIDALKKRLSKREIIENSHKRIAELEDILAKNNQALFDLERMEFIALDFQKAKDNELMSRINGMFQLVSFNFISEQLNGNEKLTCVCTVNGTPYPDVNNAGKINAGLDIINAICRSKGISAPIFIDNRESVNDLLPTISQVINLSVSRHKRLVMKTNSMFEDETTEFVEL